MHFDKGTKLNNHKCIAKFYKKSRLTFSKKLEFR